MLVENDVERLMSLDGEHLSWGDTVHYQEKPIIAESCNRDIMSDINGRVFIDTQMWHSSCNFGYANQKINAAVVGQFDKLPQVSGDFLHREKILLAEIICEEIYKRTGLKGRVSFNVSGTLVVEDALKIIRKNTGKSRMAVHTGAYHGRSLSVSALSSSHRYRQYYGNFLDMPKTFPYANCESCYYEKDKIDCNNFCGRMIKKSLETDFYGLASDDSCEIGAFLIEFCQGRGYTIPPRDFFQEYIQEFKKRNVLIVADEIQTGMYRTGKLFAFEHYGIIPDIITMSKSLTNGLTPLSAVWAREDLVSPSVFTPGHAHSNFANHILGTTAGLATWKYMLDQDYEDSVPKKGAYLLAQLQKMKNKYSIIQSVDGLGLLLNIKFGDQNKLPHKGLGKEAVSLAQDFDYEYNNEKYGLILNSGGYWGDCLKLAPMLDITYSEIDRMVAVLDQVIEKLELKHKGRKL